MNLRQFMEGSFDEGEIERLCHDLHVPYGAVSRKTPNLTIITLIEYMRRRGHLNELVSQVKKDRSEQWEKYQPVVPKAFGQDSTTSPYGFLGKAAISIAFAILIIVLIIIVIGSKNPSFFSDLFANPTEIPVAVAIAPTISPTPQIENPPTPTETGTPTASYTPTHTPTSTNSPTFTPTSTLTEMPVPNETPSPTKPPQLQVIVGKGGLRSGPDYIGYKFLDSLVNEIVVVIARTNRGTWYLVQLEDGTVGWILAQIITTPIPELTQTAIPTAVTIPSPLLTDTPTPTSTATQLFETPNLPPPPPTPTTRGAPPTPEEKSSQKT